MDNKFELMPVIRELHNISGFRISVFDTDFNEIVAFPIEQSPFCRLVKETEGREACIKSDKMAFERVARTRQPYLYQCSFGLYEAVAPLYSFGQHTGYLMMGQTLDTMSSSREFVFNNASRLAIDKTALNDAVTKIHIRAKENILSCLSIMTICAEYITLTNRLSNTKKELASQAKRYIDENLDKKLTIDLMCHNFFCSRATLITAFQRKYSESINEYIIRKRLELGHEMLERTDMSIGEIAEECGYSDQNYFAKAFLKKYGTTPTNHRKSV